MSAGHFNYKQSNIEYIADEIEELIKEGDYPLEVLERFAEAVEVLRRVYKMVRRIDWLVSGDDGSETFMRRWEEDLNEKYQINY